MIRLDKSILKFTLNPLNKQQLITNPSFSVRTTGEFRHAIDYQGS